MVYYVVEQFSIVHYQLTERDPIKPKTIEICLKS